MVDAQASAARPTVSVIMANYNSAAYLEEAIRSLQGQTMPSWELIIVDDASTDDSMALARAEAAQDSRIRLFYQQTNGGPAAARNRALDEVTGEWIAIFDNDDVMLPDRLQRLLARALAEDALVVADNQWICSSSMQPQRPFLTPSAAAALRTVDLTQFIDCSLLYSKRPTLGFLKPIIKASVIQHTALRYDADMRIGEDFSFMLKILARNVTIHIEPEPLYLYRKHGASISHRISLDSIQAMIAADERFAEAAAPLSRPAQRVLRRRIYGLHSWLAYERMVAAFKAGRILQGMAAIATRPHAWPLATRPLRARAARMLGARLRFGSPRRPAPSGSALGI